MTNEEELRIRALEMAREDYSHQVIIVDHEKVTERADFYFAYLRSGLKPRKSDET